AHSPVSRNQAKIVSISSNLFIFNLFLGTNKKDKKTKKIFPTRARRRSSPLSDRTGVPLPARGPYGNICAKLS
ncbi:MAG: hypothetical protein MSH25_09165, partial [Desulfovibrio sp.]|uniref:hypothetical protein n=1 Tax=Desulfovibrio sp. TaxID=885 RepID=UPI0025BC26DE